jgi:hypothetical protein
MSIAPYVIAKEMYETICARGKVTGHRRMHGIFLLEEPIPLYRPHYTIAWSNSVRGLGTE